MAKMNEWILILARSYTKAGFHQVLTSEGGLTPGDFIPNSASNFVVQQNWDNIRVEHYSPAARLGMFFCRQRNVVIGRAPFFFRQRLRQQKGLMGLMLITAVTS